VTDDACGVISISFGYCGQPDSFYPGTLAPIFARAAIQGQSVFVSSGDDGAAGLILNGNVCIASSRRSVSEMSADRDVTSVGGTQFDAKYDLANNDLSTALDGLESAWNESGRNEGATGGGVSAIFPVPSWQTGSLVAPETMRMIPDIALGAAVYNRGFHIQAFYQGANRLTPVGVLASPRPRGPDIRD
jgi:subtilase family serine protease